MGYHLAGFEMTGVDIKPQPRYPFTFIQGDALEYVAAHGHEYDAVFASPPCQGYSRMRHLPWLKDRVYPMLIEPTRNALNATGLPWVIENVEGSPLGGVTLCGVMFGLKTYRHRLFESNILLFQPTHQKHLVRIGTGNAINSRGGVTPEGFVSAANKSNVAACRIALGIDWMSRDGLTQAIPPAFTEYIGKQLIAALANREMAAAS